ncbi:MAG: ABC transporter ATP-binding protein [Prochloraceae cyanobacterium]|nr:ABC transporter ATP-binding protein [Prochloraceae cyanobacterium]
MSRPQTIQESLPGLMRIWRYFWPYVCQYRLLVSVSLLGLLAEVGLRLLEPWPLKVVFDYIFVSAPLGEAQRIPFLDTLTPGTLLALAVLGLVAIAGLRALAAYYYVVGFALVGNRVLTQVRQDLYHHLQHLSLSFHNKARKGDLVVRVISDVGMVQDITITALLPLLGNSLILMGMLAVMLWINWELTLLALLTVPLFYISTMRLSRRIQEVSRQQRRREGKMASTAAESLGAIEIVQALSLEGIFADFFSSENKKTLKEGVKAKRLAARLVRTVDFLIAIAYALVLWRGASLVLQQKLTPGDLLVFLAYLKNGLKPVQSFAKYTGRLAKASAAGDRVLDIMQQIPEVRDLPGAISAPAFQGTVQFERVSFGYEVDRIILRNIDFKVNPGQQVAIVGASGSGKSTLASLLLRLYDPVEGRVLIDGHDIRNYTLKSLRSQISVVLQESILFAASVRDNIAYGEQLATLPEIVEAARLANAREFIEALPEGYDTILGERGVTISGGQRQRLAIARAFLRKSPILIFDEPTTGLDKNSEREVIEALERLARNRTTFIITHDLHLAARADLILYIEGGCVLECGTHSELMRNNNRYADLYQIQLVKRR